MYPLVCLMLLSVAAAAAIPRCSEATANAVSLADFLRLQQLWGDCIADEKLVEEHYEQFGNFATHELRARTQSRIRFEMCRERVSSKWTGTRCAAESAVNGTVLIPLDTINAALAPFINALVTRVEWKTEPCEYCIAFVSGYKPGWYNCHTMDPDRCDGELVDRYGSLMTCKLCEGTIVWPVVMIE